MANGSELLIEICKARNGERCRNCIFYRKQCDRFRERHNGLKPVEYFRLGGILNEQHPARIDDGHGTQ